MESYPNIPHPYPTQNTAHSRAQQRAESGEQRAALLCAVCSVGTNTENKKQKTKRRRENFQNFGDGPKTV